MAEVAAAATGAGAGTQTAGGENPAAASGATAATAQVTTATSDWTASLPEAHKMFVQNKGFKDMSMALDSYKHLETLMGAPKERLIKMPEKSDDVAAWGEVYDRLGRPKSSSEYQFKVPEGITQDPASTKWAQELFHKAGLTKSQGEMIANEWNNNILSGEKQSVEARTVQTQTERAALQKEWGGAWDDKRKSCAAAMQAFGIDTAAVTKIESALGYSATMKLLSNIGSKVAESRFIDGSGPHGLSGAMTPDQGRAMLAEKRKDSAWVARYNSGDYAAKEEMAKIMQAIAPEPREKQDF